MVRVRLQRRRARWCKAVSSCRSALLLMVNGQPGRDLPVVTVQTIRNAFGEDARKYARAFSPG